LVEGAGYEVGDFFFVSRSQKTAALKKSRKKTEKRDKGSKAQSA
jgi:hypothetical protein